MPTAPESLPTAHASKARRSRSRLRSASNAKPASRSPKLVGSAWIPWVRPTQTVSRWREGLIDQRVAEPTGALDQQIAPASTI